MIEVEDIRFAAEECLNVTQRDTLFTFFIEFSVDTQQFAEILHMLLTEELCVDDRQGPALMQLVQRICGKFLQRRSIDLEDTFYRYFFTVVCLSA